MQQCSLDLEVVQHFALLVCQAVLFAVLERFLLLKSVSMEYDDFRLLYIYMFQVFDLRVEMAQTC